jgi:hypothetical protein
MGTTTERQTSAAARPPRIETPERWAAALERAAAANLAYMELIGGDGAWAVSSTKDPERGYVATAGACTCEAGRAGDPVCLHRALVRRLVGLMDDRPDPTPPAAPACPICDNRGYVADPDGRRRPERCVCPAGSLRPAA